MAKNTRLTLTQPIINLCSRFAMYDIDPSQRTSLFDTLRGPLSNPYQQGYVDDKGCDDDTVAELMRQMLNAMYDPEEVYDIICAPSTELNEGEPNCLHCQKYGPSILHMTYSYIVVGNVTVPLCMDCKAELLRIHRNISRYMSIIIQCGREPGIYEQYTTKNLYGGDMVYWKRVSPKRESFEKMFGISHY